MDIYQRLQRDHELQRRLAAQLNATEGDSAERRRLWDALKAELDAHANAEEQTLYAALIERPESQEKSRHSIAEHQEMTKKMEALADIDMSSPGWLQSFKVLEHQIEHHLKEEEEDVFPLAKRVLDQSTAEELTAQFEERKAGE